MPTDPHRVWCEQTHTQSWLFHLATSTICNCDENARTQISRGAVLMNIQVSAGWHRKGARVCKRLASLCLGFQDKSLLVGHNRGPGGCLIVRGLTCSPLSSPTLFTSFRSCAIPDSKYFELFTTTRAPLTRLLVHHAPCFSRRLCTRLVMTASAN
jgi:hypothetical protein